MHKGKSPGTSSDSENNLSRFLLFMKSTEIKKEANSKTGNSAPDSLENFAEMV